MLTICFLGYPSVTLHQQALSEFISQKALVLLCYLALEPRPHARETLAGLFWGELPQERALSNLRQALHNLQKLAPDYWLINRQTAQFNAKHAHQWDVQRLQNPAPHDTLEGLDQAFMAGIYMNDAADLNHWIQQRRQNYHTRYCQILEMRLNDAHQRADWDAIRQWAAQLISQDPYRETAYHSLWRAYVQRNELNSALASVNALQTRLSEELALDLSPASQTLAERLRLAQQAPRHNLPHASSRLVGRQAELAQVSQWLRHSDCRLITLLGVGGVGKSRLAQAIGQNEVGHFINGVCYVPLASVPDSLFVLSALAQALGLSLRNVAQPQREIYHYLAQRELLLILDNVEHLSDLSALLDALLAQAPALKVLVTSRQRLNLHQEWVLALEGLAHAEDAESASFQLFAQSAAQYGYRLPDVAQTLALCRQLEGLPLALELAAGMLHSTDNAQVLSAIEHNLDVLQAPWHNIPERQRSLRAVFMSSWEWLSREEQEALSRLAIFAAHFSASAALAVAQADEAVLQRLHMKSLLRRHEAERYSLHSVIRHYAQAFQSDASATRSAFSAYYLGYLAEVEDLFSQRNIPQAVQAFEQELEHLRYVWHMALAQRELDTLGRMMATLHRFYEGIGWFTEGVSLFQASLKRLNPRLEDEQERLIAGRLWAHQAGLLLRVGDVGQALQQAEQAVNALAQAEDSPQFMAFALNAQGIAQLYSGKTEAAQTSLEHCAALYRRLGLPDLLKPLINLGSLYTRTGERQRALEVLQEAHPLALALGDQVGAYHITNGLGVVLSLQGEHAQAIRYYQEALHLSEVTGFLQGKSITLNNLGDAYTQAGEAQMATAYAEQAVQLAQHIKDKRSLSYALNTLALNQLALDHLQAPHTLQQALQTALESGAEPILLMVLYSVGIWHERQQRPQAAHKLWACVAQHPASEMDYRQRAQQKLGGLAKLNLPVTPPEAPRLLVEQSLAHLQTGSF